MSLFPMNACGMRARLILIGAAGFGAAMVAGCGSQYRSVVTSTNPSGPASQPQSQTVVVSSPSATSDGIATVLDYSGDTVMATAAIGPDPQSFTLDYSGSTGYTVNTDHTLTNFPGTTSLHYTKVTYSTLDGKVTPWGMFSPSSGLWVTDLTKSEVDVLTGSPEAFVIGVPVAPTPVAVVGAGSGAKRYFSLSLNNASTLAGNAITVDGMACNTAPSSVTQNGEADGIEISSSSGIYSVSSNLPLGKCPVYGVANASGTRIFVLNRGSDTITVINTQTDALDACTPFQNQSGQTVTCHPTLPLSTAGVASCPASAPCPVSNPDTANLQAVAGPVYAEYNAATQQLVVANYDGGTVSIIDVSMDVYGNDGPTFGTTYTVKVGETATPYPAAVTVLSAGDRAYTANQGDDPGSTGNGTVSIINLSSHKLEKTISVVGHPRTVVSTSNSLYGKVYAASPDSEYLTVIDTTQDAVSTTVQIQGDIVDVRTANQNGISNNAQILSRRPGAGQPCYLPPTVKTSTSLTECQLNTNTED